MCGIAGFFDTSASYGNDELAGIVRSMADTLRHRGPDDAGVWVDEMTGVALGHRRLSIIDLSPSGHQPMASRCGRFVIVYNGEVYNFPDIREELEAKGHRFVGGSDTEVILAAISHWGLDEAVKRFNGMFAFALWDKRERNLHLVRDRIGIKPLYYGWLGKVFLFGSELKALRRFPGFAAEIDRESLCLFLRHNYIPAPRSIYKGFYKLRPGYVLTVREPGNAEETVYWSLKDVAEKGLSDTYPRREEEAVEELDALLRDAVKRRMVSDVPLGAFLSGGYDSSTVVALMQVQSSRPVRSFTIGFNEKGYNEAHYAKKVAQHLGTEHTELYITPKEAMDVIPRLPEIYDEPFSDSSQIPTFLVSQLTRRHVTVSLSGDGGDELFAGYNRYFFGRSIWKKVGWWPRGVRSTAAGILRNIPVSFWSGLERLEAFLPERAHIPQLDDKAKKVAEIISAKDAGEFYHSLVSHWKHPIEVVAGVTEDLDRFNNLWSGVEFSDITQRMQYLDLVTYLPDDILVKVDRASMEVSLEARVPILDHRVVEFAWRLPLSMKLRKGRGKWLLRQVLYRYVPRKLMERPKMGFGVPIEQWLRGPLREWGEELLDEQRLRQEGFFDPAPIRRMWEEHLSGKRRWHYYLWDILMFQAWMERNEF